MKRFVTGLGAAMRLSPSDRRLVIETVLSLLDARLRCAIFPFKKLARHLGGITPVQDALPSPPQLNSDQTQVVKAISWSIEAVAPLMPFKAVCLQQAIAARKMLDRRRIDSVLHLGVGKPDGTVLEAHAWLDAGGIAVTGYPVHPALIEVGRFV